MPFASRSTFLIIPSERFVFIPIHPLFIFSHPSLNDCFHSVFFFLRNTHLQSCRIKSFRKKPYRSLPNSILADESSWVITKPSPWSVFLFVFFLGGRGDATRPSQWILNYRASRGPFWKRTEKPLVGSTDYDRKKRKRPETHRATYRSAYTNNEELFRHPTPNSSKRGNWEGGGQVYELIP